MIFYFQKIIDLLFYPVLFSALGGIFFIIYKKKLNPWYFFCVLTVLLAVTWRFLIVVTVSKRYFCILIIPAIVFSSIFFENLYLSARSSIQKTGVIFILFICVFIQVGKVFHADSHTYIPILQQIINEYQIQDPYSVLYIYYKEWNRFGFFKDSHTHVLEENQQTPEKIRACMEPYRYWESPVLFLRKESVKDDYLTAETLSILKEEASFDRIVSLFTDSHHTKRLSLYRYTPEAIKISQGNSKNLIENGDMEIQMSNKDVKARLKPWIDNGASFYDSDSIVLPKHESLLSTWSIYEQYPEVFSDSKNVISGNYSLNVKLNGTPAIYLMKTVPAVPGYLSWTMRGLDDTVLRLTRYEYEESGQILYPSMQYFFHINKGQERQIQIDLTKETFIGSKMLFLLHSNNAHFLLDDLCYVPKEEKFISK